MPEAFAGHLRMNAIGEQMGCVGVPQIVEPEMRQLSGADRADPIESRLRNMLRVRGWKVQGRHYQRSDR
jgi:hypothetical protein